MHRWGPGRPRLGLTMGSDSVVKHGNECRVKSENRKVSNSLILQAKNIGSINRDGGYIL